MKPNYAQTILQILEERDPAKTMCPSEVLPEAQKQNKEMMEQVRGAAIRLARAGQIEIVQRGELIDIENIKGPIRLRKPRSKEACV